MKNKAFLAFLVLVVAIVFSSCTARLGSFTVISTKNIDWSRTSEYIRKDRRLKGIDKLHLIVLVPTKMTVDIQSAVDNALEQIPGGIALVDAVLRYHWFYVPYIYGRMTYVIEGSVLIDPQLAELRQPLKSNYLVIYSPNGKEFIMKEVSEKEFRRL